MTLTKVLTRLSTRYPEIIGITSKRVGPWWIIDATTVQNGRVVIVRATEKTAAQCLRAMGC